MLVFFPVPPSVVRATAKRSTRRQAAGPLIRNLPNVFMGGPYRADLTGDRNAVDLSLERPSPRGTQRRLPSLVIAQAPRNGRLSFL